MYQEGLHKSGHITGQLPDGPNAAPIALSRALQAHSDAATGLPLERLANWLADWIVSKTGVEITTLSINNSGWSNLVIDINHHWILRLPKQLIAPEKGLPAPRFALEQAIITALCHHGLPPSLMPALILSSASKANTAGSTATDILPEVMLYPKIDGAHRAIDSLSLEAQQPLAQQLARFLASLHRLPRDPELVGLGLNAFPYGDDDFLADILPTAAAHLSRDGQRNALAYFEHAVNRFEHNLPPKPHICHGDFGPGNILIGPDGSLDGVLDFSDVCLGDPAMDLAPLWRRTSLDFFAALLAHYQTELGDTHWQALDPESLMERIQFQALRKAAFVIWYAERYGFEDGIQNSLGYLKHHFE